MTAEYVNITILVDNKAGLGLVGEHGLSLWIECGGHKILFDTGQGLALPFNAYKLGADLESADILVLSQGHYDHTGGVFHVLQRNPEVHVYCHPAAVLPRYSLYNGAVRHIHMPHSTMAAIDKIGCTGSRSLLLFRTRLALPALFPGSTNMRTSAAYSSSIPREIAPTPLKTTYP